MDKVSLVESFSDRETGKSYFAGEEYEVGEGEDQIPLSAAVRAVAAGAGFAVEGESEVAPPAPAPEEPQPEEPEVSPE